MKPAFNVPQTMLFEGSETHKQVTCLRCRRNLERYQLTHFAPLSNAAGSGQAMLVCPSCGHVEFIVEGSPLLSSLELACVDTGDGD